MKIALAIQSYIDWKSTYTTKAFLDYPKILRRFAQICPKPLEKIGPEDIALFRLTLKTKFNLGEHSISHYLIVVKNFIKFQRDRGVRVMNPDLIRIRKDYVVRGHTPITPEEFKLLDEGLNKNRLPELQRKVALRLMWETGVRVSELCDIRISQIGPSPRLLIKNKKNDEQDWIFWSHSTHTLLQEYIERSAGLRNTPFLFFSLADGLPCGLNTRSVQRWVKELCQRAGIKKKISPHSFRHGRAHFIRDRGGDIFDIAKILRHKNVQSSQHYLKYGHKEVEKRARRWLK